MDDLPCILAFEISPVKQGYKYCKDVSKKQKQNIAIVIPNNVANSRESLSAKSSTKIYYNSSKVGRRLGVRIIEIKIQFYLKV